MAATPEKVACARQLIVTGLSIREAAARVNVGNVRASCRSESDRHPAPELILHLISGVGHISRAICT